MKKLILLLCDNDECFQYHAKKELAGLIVCEDLI